MENINRGVDDIFYRYKMPKLMAKVEGNGNGIKTVLPNIKEVAKALSRPPECEFSLSPPPPPLLTSPHIYIFIDPFSFFLFLCTGAEMIATKL